MPVTQTLNQLLRQKEQFDREYEDEMPPRVAQCYRNLVREIERAADRNQQMLPGITRTAPEDQRQGVLL